MQVSGEKRFGMLGRTHLMDNQKCAVKIQAQRHSHDWPGSRLHVQRKAAELWTDERQPICRGPLRETPGILDAQSDGHPRERNSRFLMVCITSKIYLHLNSFWMPYDLVRLSINDSLNSLFVNISLGAGEILTFWHHMKLTIPAELWGHITHISVYLWGILLDGGMTEKKIKSLCCLSTFAWTFPATSAEHFISCLRLSGHNFLVQRMRHDRNRRPYELGICDRCDWHTIQDEEHILLDCPHEPLVRLRTQ